MPKVPSKKALVLATASVGVLVGLAVVFGPTIGQLNPWYSSSGIEINYVPPVNQAHQPIYERLKKRGVLEHYKEFISPLRLPRPVQVTTEGCNGKINAWYANGKITYCYEYMAFMEEVARRGSSLPGFRPEDALVGAFVQVLLHETAHMVFAQLDVPLLGREEDAADQIASFILLNLGKTTARRALTGAAFFWRALAAKQNYGLEDYADEHGTYGQRFFNTLCIAHGSDIVLHTTTFDDFIQRKLLPDSRRVRCAHEFLQTKKAFDQLIRPYVNLVAMKRVQGSDLLKPEDGVDALPPAAPSETAPNSLDDPAPGSGAPNIGPGTRPLSGTSADPTKQGAQ